MNAQADGGVAAVNRALTALLAFGDAPNGLMLAQVSEATGLNMSTLLRLFESMEMFQFIKRMPDGRYVLGPATFHLGMMYRESFQLREYAVPILTRLSEESGETSALYVRDGDERVCLFRFYARICVKAIVSRSMSVQRAASCWRFPAHAEANTRRRPNRAMRCRLLSAIRKVPPSHVRCSASAALSLVRFHWACRATASTGRCSRSICHT
jgi:hypothetical protein